MDYGTHPRTAFDAFISGYERRNLSGLVGDVLAKERADSVGLGQPECGRLGSGP